MKFPDMVHALKPSPKTHLQMGWRIMDFFSHIPEAMNMVLIPRSPSHHDQHELVLYGTSGEALHSADAPADGLASSSGLMNLRYLICCRICYLAHLRLSTYATACLTAENPDLCGVAQLKFCVRSAQLIYACVRCMSESTPPWVHAVHVSAGRCGHP